jgi:hypothetical protein
MRPLIRFTQRLASRPWAKDGRVNVIRGRIDNNHVTVEVDLGDGYERRMRQAKILIAERLIMAEAISHRFWGAH